MFHFSLFSFYFQPKVIGYYFYDQTSVCLFWSPVVCNCLVAGLRVMEAPPGLSSPVDVSLEVCGLAVGNIVGQGSGLLE